MNCWDWILTPFQGLHGWIPPRIYLPRLEARFFRSSGIITYEIYGHRQAENYLAGASKYMKVVQKEVAEMHRQVELHKTNHEDVALRGFMIRHLVVPYLVAGTQ